MLYFDPFLPPVDVTVSDSDLVLTMDVPGLTAEDLTIELLDTNLYVRGRRRRPELSDGSSWQHVERTFGNFERPVRVPAGVDPESITASIDDGVLSLIIPKPERMKPRTIAIAGGETQRQLETTTA